MKRKKGEGTLHVSTLKKRKIDDQEATLAKLLLLYESGRDEKQLTACKAVSSVLL